MAHNRTFPERHQDGRLSDRAAAVQNVAATANGHLRHVENGDESHERCGYVGEWIDIGCDVESNGFCRIICCGIVESNSGIMMKIAENGRRFSQCL